MGRGHMAPAIRLSARHHRLLESELSRRRTEVQYRSRIEIILRSAEGCGISPLSKELKTSIPRVKRWRNRWEGAYDRLIAFEAGPDGQGVSDSELLKEMLSVFDDVPRSGRSKEISLEQEAQIVSMSCKSPRDFGHIRDKWTHKLLAKVALSMGIVEHLSPRYVGVILKKAATATP